MIRDEWGACEDMILISTIIIVLLKLLLPFKGAYGGYIGVLFHAGHFKKLRLAG